MPMFWYNSGTWRQTTELSVYQSGTWKQVLECWIWNGLAWKSCHVATTSLNTVTVTDFLCSPTLGTYRVAWTYTSPNIGDWFLRVEARFNGGAWTTVADNIDPTTSPYTDTVDGYPGFSSLDTTDFRINLLAVSDGTTQANGSPVIQFGPFSC